MWGLPLRLTQVTDETNWDELIQELPGHGVYQAWSWGELRKGPHREVRRYALVEGGEVRAAVAIELRRLARLPWRIAYAPRGPLWRDPRDLEALLGDLPRGLSELSALHLKINPERPPSEDATLGSLGFSRVSQPDRTFGGILPELSARLRLPASVEALRGAMEPEARRRIRQAERRGLRVEQSGPEGLGEFYPWLQATADRQSFFLPPREALQEIVRVWTERGEGALLLARSEGRCVGGALCSFFGEEGVGHFLADDPSSRHLSTAYALYDAGLTEASARGCRFFALGGIQSTADDGLFGFKRQFGARPVRLVGEWNLPVRRLPYALLSVSSRGRFSRRI